MTEAETAFPIWAFLAVPLIWWAILRLSAWISGWRAVAEAYPAQDEFNGETRSMQSAGFEGAGFLPANYSGVLSVGANREGVRFATVIALRIGHAPFFIPYEELQAEEGSLFFIPYVRLRAAKTPDVAIRIRRRLARWIEEQSGGAWRYQRLPASD